MDHYSTFKPGDKVRIVKPDTITEDNMMSADPEIPHGNTWVGPMDSMVGITFTLSSKSVAGWSLKEAGYYYWLPEWFEHAETEVRTMEDEDDLFW